MTLAYPPAGCVPVPQHSVVRILPVKKVSLWRECYEIGRKELYSQQSPWRETQTKRFIDERVHMYISLRLFPPLFFNIFHISISSSPSFFLFLSLSLSLYIYIYIYSIFLITSQHYLDLLSPSLSHCQIHEHKFRKRKPLPINIAQFFFFFSIPLKLQFGQFSIPPHAYIPSQSIFT